MISTLLYACKIGDPDYMQDIIYECRGYVNKTELLKKGEEWAQLNGYDRLRIATIDLSIPPDFKKTVSI